MGRSPLAGEAPQQSGRGVAPHKKSGKRCAVHSVGPCCQKDSCPRAGTKRGESRQGGVRQPAAGKRPPNSRPLQTSAAKPQKGRAQTASPPSARVCTIKRSSTKTSAQKQSAPAKRGAQLGGRPSPPGRRWRTGLPQVAAALTRKRSAVHQGRREGVCGRADNVNMSSMRERRSRRMAWFPPKAKTSRNKADFVLAAETLGEQDSRRLPQKRKSAQGRQRRRGVVGALANGRGKRGPFREEGAAAHADNFFKRKVATNGRRSAALQEVLTKRGLSRRGRKRKHTPQGEIYDTT